MSAVNAMEGIEYGFRLIGYFIVVGLVGGVVMLVGSGFLSSAQDGFSTNTGAMLFGVIIFLAGTLVIYAGLFGVMYKVMADAVKAGIESAE